MMTYSRVNNIIYNNQPRRYNSQTICDPKDVATMIELMMRKLVAKFQYYFCFH